MRRKDREITERAAILDIIAGADSCRLAMVDCSGAVPLPYIVALNFGFSPEPDRFWFHCARQGRKIDILRANPRVCLQLDSDHRLITGPAACDWGMAYASIVAEGTIAFVEGPAERRFGLDCLMKHYTGGAPFGDYHPGELRVTEVLRLDVAVLTAKRKQPPAAPA
jgi:nitroimidazol reductase NimA-like FMN-containing flavoprotein (pyridoxamine 5'-phosphate oxidase superfamily)